MLFLLHFVEELCRSFFHLGFDIVGDSDAALDAVDELADEGVGAFVVLVATGHLDHLLGKLIFSNFIFVVMLTSWRRVSLVIAGGSLLSKSFRVIAPA